MKLPSLQTALCGLKMAGLQDKEIMDDDLAF